MKNKKINVLHIVGGKYNSGAFKGAYYLHKGLVDKGINSTIYSNYYEKKFYSNLFSFFREKIDKSFKIFFRKRKKTSFSVGLIGVNFLNTKAYINANIIHLHWINDGFFNISYLTKIKKPIIWTLRDMWAFTGGCHYAFGCNKYLASCNKCPQLGSSLKSDLSYFIQQRKLKYINKNINFVAISNWLKKKANKSRILKNHKIDKIYNGVDKKIFYKVKSDRIKKKYNLPTKKKIILFSSPYIDSEYKGFNFFLESLKYLDKNLFFIILLGNKWNFRDIDKSGFKYLHIKYKGKEQNLREIYSLTDVFIMSSIQEAFGKAAVESIFCKTPVVGFKNTALEEIINHKKNGYLADYKDSKSLAKGIKWLSKNKTFKSIETNKTFYKSFDLSYIGDKYINLYDKILNQQI